MGNELKLTEGNIIGTLTRLAIPIMGTSFIQMAYNLTDVMWLGRLDTKAVAGAGTAGFFLWFAASLVMISQIGVGVNVSQSLGRGDREEAKRYISSGYQVNIVIALTYGMLLYFFRNQIIGFFKIDDMVVVKMAISYLSIISMGMLFFFVNPVFSTTLNSSGNSVTPFKTNTIGLIVNMIFDPVLIFGLGPFPKLGVEGAAIATVFAQIVVTLIFLIEGYRKQSIYSHVKILGRPEFSRIRRMIKLGIPPFLQMGIHATVSMVITRLIAGFGAVPIAVQSIGSQIESISWMTSEGFSSAISAFVGQNYGAKKYERIRQGYKSGIKVLGSIGIGASLILIFGAEHLFTIFTPKDPEAILGGISYLRILGLSQLFMSIEIGTAGAFNGLGRTVPPTMVGMSFNLLRIPLAVFLSTYTALGLLGIWWAISISSILKGLLLFAWFNFFLSKMEHSQFVL
ncbi:MAG: MATE family efflux transporter [Gudongella sp.]|jgi:putative MATE family efflux protein|nr:MATE family efflux transporter [Gudongella sp.]